MRSDAEKMSERIRKETSGPKRILEQSLGDV